MIFAALDTSFEGKHQNAVTRSVHEEGKLIASYETIKANTAKFCDSNRLIPVITGYQISIQLDNFNLISKGVV